MTSTSADPVASTDWESLAQRIDLPTGLFVDGAFRNAIGGGERAIVSPRDGSRITTMSWATDADADAAVGAAREAFNSGSWSRRAPRERGECLQRWADLLEAHRSELAVLISLEMGKPIRDTYSIELRAIIRCLRYYGELADKGAGEVLPTPRGELALVTREPAGVVAAVVPWNFPLTLAGWKIGPALAAGCSVVLKTAENSPLSMQRVAELGYQAGLPRGVLNVLNGDGHVVGRRLGEHQDVDVLTFTGSTEVGRHFLRYAADSNLKRVYLELGGKSPNIILPNAPDLDAAADTAAWAIFFNSGEMCTAGSRLIVHESVADRVIERVVESAANWFPGDPLDAATRMGPLASSAHRDRVLGMLRDGLASGGRVLTGGTPMLEQTGGYFVAPTVVADVPTDNLLHRDEIFGPVLTVRVVDSEESAVAAAGDTPYGLAAAVWTSDLGVAHRVSRALRAGTVWVNCYEEGDMNAPFGGVKLSGFGRDKSRHAIDEYTDVKTTWINYG